MNRFALRQFLAQGIGRFRGLLGLVLGLALVLTGCGKPTNDFQFPSQDSTVAANSDALYYFIFWICVFYLAHIAAVMIWFMVKYRRRPGVEPKPSPNHNLVLEIAWSIPPCVLVVFMFWWGFTSYMDLATPPADAYKINVMAKQWNWTFTYANGAKAEPTVGAGGKIMSPVLHVPIGEPVEVILESQDVLHAFFIPNFRVKQDIVPGRVTELWFEANKAGSFWLFCAEYCGAEHSSMITRVKAEPRAEFDAYVASLIEDEGPPGPNLIKGQKVYNSLCIACHPTGKAPSALAPGFGGLYGSQRKVFDPSAGKEIEVTADDAYIRESILNPSAKLSRMGKEFLDVMTKTYGSDLTEEQIESVILFLKELK